jgi:predicted metal-dependent enzyme (double-stranded beta helix superfamily)
MTACLSSTRAAPPARGARSGPSAAPLHELRRTVRRYAANPNLSTLLTTAQEHTWARLAGDGRLDVWLASWPEEAQSRWHDHGPAASALAVVTGALEEQTWALDAVQRRHLVEGESPTFGPGHIHQLRNAAPGRTLTVHAYAPGLVTLGSSQDREYELGPSGRVRRAPGTEDAR